MNDLSYKDKYLKYKKKYIELKQLAGYGYKNIDELKKNFIDYVGKNKEKNKDLKNLFTKEKNGIRICTYNIHYFTDLYEEKNTYFDVLNDIKLIDADILILEEVIIGSIIKINSKLIIDVSSLYTQLNELGYHKIIACNNVPSWFNGIYCNLILIHDRILSDCVVESVASIESITKCEKLNESIVSFPKGKSSVVVSGKHKGTKETRCYIYINYNTPEYNFHIYGTHLDVASEEERLNQIKNIIENSKQFNKEKDYILILGDFNTLDKRKVYPDEEKMKFIKSNAFIKDNGAVVEEIKVKNNFTDLLGRNNDIEMTTWNNTIVDFIFMKNGKGNPIPDNLIPKVYFTLASDHLPVILDIPISK